MPHTGPPLTASNPATGEPVWSGPTASPDDLAAALARAGAAFGPWSTTPFDDRVAVIERFGAAARAAKDDIVACISDATGKPRWEAAQEAGAMAGKPALAIRAHRERLAEQRIDLTQGDAPRAGVVRYRPHGVMAVLGPFNLPGHLPGSHLVPALLAGNTAVFKPSELTPGVGELIASLWRDAGLPDGVLELVQGAGDIGRRLVESREIHGVLFTGGAATGVAIRRSLADRPGVIAALELGGNSPVIVHEPGDVQRAARLAVVSAFAGAGQRCNGARRFVVTDHADADAFVEAFAAAASRVRVGLPSDDPEPFCGPVITPAAGQRVLDTQHAWRDAGARVLLDARGLHSDTRLITPGIIDTTGHDVGDYECFGPLCRIVRVKTLDDALREANATRFGLTAAVWCADRAVYDALRPRLRAGLVNWNQPTTGASGALPFGGVGDSGNHRPSGYFACDYAAYPVASLEAETLPDVQPPGLDA